MINFFPLLWSQGDNLLITFTVLEEQHFLLCFLFRRGPIPQHLFISSAMNEPVPILISLRYPCH